ncbi:MULTISPECIES: ABC transporter substrate-binding protein [Acidiphilium]|uniref:Amino acid/amide ABC transporter substrate-binding protein, HAAT family n=1 Tax=Acidiphilium rubrum TaxID=526 RepID=A0A8G2FH19_ACIRU|nr:MULTISPECIES: ABC transporter substrate-binding protein [Acidiphilium]SIR01678.1 amino acid/amide ABC transporter substrate-binding protein, HAAT family [Acidiphilium rubrum]
MTTQPLVSRAANLSRRTLLGSGLAVAASRSGAAAVRSAAPSSPTLAALFPDQGAEALAGDEAWRGVTLAIADANRGRKQPIRLIRADATDPARTIATLAKADPPAAFIGTSSSTLSFVATAAAELANIPYIELDAPADAITTRGFKMLVRTGLTSAALAATTTTAIAGQIAPSWRKAAGELRIALLFDDGATNGAFAAAMLDLARQTKLPVVLTLGYATNTMDLASEIGRMQRAKIDLLIHAGRTEHVLLAYAAMATAGWRPRMIIGAGGGYAMSGLGFALGRAIENTMVVDTPLYDVSGPAAAIARAYRARYAAPPRSSASLTAYVGAQLVSGALGQDKPFRAALLATDRPRGALANGWGCAFNGQGQNRASFATLQQWRGGRLITIDPTIAGAAHPITSL